MFQKLKEHFCLTLSISGHPGVSQELLLPWWLGKLKGTPLRFSPWVIHQKKKMLIPLWFTETCFSHAQTQRASCIWHFKPNRHPMVTHLKALPHDKSSRPQQNYSEQSDLEALKEKGWCKYSSCSSSSLSNTHFIWYCSYAKGKGFSSLFPMN